MTQKQNVFNWHYENRFRVTFMSTRDDIKVLGESCVVASIPTIIMGVTPQPTNIRQIHIPGDSMEYEDLNLQFLVQEDLSNYIALVDWMYRLRDPNTVSLSREVIDIGIDILDAKSNLMCEVTVIDAFPFTISDIPLTVSIDDVEPSRMDVSFKVNGLKFNKL